MANFRPLSFIRAAGTLGATSVALSVVLFVVSIVEHERDKNVPAYWFIYLAPAFFAVGAYLAWSAERDKWEEEKAKNQKPELSIDLIAAFWDTYQPPGTCYVWIHVYAYLRVANLREPPTLIKQGCLTMTIGDVEYSGNGDDVSISGGWLEHNTAFKLGGEKKGSVFSETYTPVRRLTSDINWEYPLVRGVHRDGIVVFTFQNQMDWQGEIPGENSQIMSATHLCLSLTDTFNQPHSIKIDRVDIPNGTLHTKPAAISGI
jgi:hypothetical protein